MAIRKDGKVWEQVHAILDEHRDWYDLMKDAGIDLAEMKIVSFGRGTYHDIMVGDRIVGSYNHIAKRVTFVDANGAPCITLEAKRRY